MGDDNSEPNVWFMRYILDFWSGNCTLYRINDELIPEYLISLGDILTKSEDKIVPGTRLDVVYKNYQAGNGPLFDNIYLVGFFTNDTGFDAVITIFPLFYDPRIAYPRI